MSLQDILFEKYIKALKYWRNQDHEDNIVLSRTEVCTILDGIEKLGRYSFRVIHCWTQEGVPPLVPLAGSECITLHLKVVRLLKREVSIC